MFESSLIEISTSALQANLRFLRRQIGAHPVICSVVKGNAYGHGIERFVPMAEELGIDRFATATAHEAVRVATVRKPGTKVMIMGYLPIEAVSWAIAEDISFWVSDLERLATAIEQARRLDRPARVHLELETGLHRTGLEESDLGRVAAMLEDAGDSVIVEGTCTHYAGAESVSNYHRIQNQRQRFVDLCDRLGEGGVSLGLRHTACSAAALTEPESIMDMVRIGIAQYGFWPSRETRMNFVTRTGRKGKEPLRRLLTWKSKVMAVKTVRAGKFVGYGNHFLTEKRSRIAVIPVGYGDGYSRSLSNLGWVLIRGRRASVAGVVNMSALMVDVTLMPEVSAGDEVVLIGKQGKLSISVSSFSDMARTVDYETLVGLPADIPRSIVD